MRECTYNSTSNKSDATRPQSATSTYLRRARSTGILRRLRVSAWWSIYVHVLCLQLAVDRVLALEGERVRGCGRAR